ncbi:unnamed protein product, partial [marine sediment metagenome]
MIDAFLDSKAVSIMAPINPVRYKDTLEMTLAFLPEIAMNIPPSMVLRHLQKIKSSENWRLDYFLF